MLQRPNSKLKVDECRLCLLQRIFATFMLVVYMTLENVLPPSNALWGAAQMASKKSRLELLVLNNPVVTNMQQGKRVEAALGMLMLNFFVFLQLRFQDFI